MALLKWIRGPRLPKMAALLALGLSTLAPTRALAQTADSAPEYAVKAGYLLNFARYAEWRADAFASPTAPILICVLGEDPFGELLDRVVGGRVSQSRPLSLRRSRRVEELRACHVVFISRSERMDLPAILATLRGTHAVTVCDMDALFDQGVMIKLAVVKETVRFEVMLEPAERAGLRFNSRMLDAALRVWPREPAKEE